MARIVVIGVGDSGKNVINYVYEFEKSYDYKEKIEFFLIDTDKNSIDNFKGEKEKKIFLDNSKINGLGTASNRDIAIEVAKENIEKIKSVLIGADVVFLITGLSGGTGSGISEVISDICNDEKIILIIHTFKYFIFESENKKNNFVKSLSYVKEKANGIIVVSNEKLLSCNGDNFVSYIFEVSRKITWNNIKSLLDLIFCDGIISISLLDLKNFLLDSKFTVIGNANDFDQLKILEAINEAIFSPILEIDMQDAKKIICSISCRDDISSNIINNCLDIIRDKIGKVDSRLIILKNKNIKHGRINISIIGFNCESSTINNYFVSEEDPIKVKNILNDVDKMYKETMNAEIDENDITPFFIKNPDNKYGNKK